MRQPIARQLREQRQQMLAQRLPKTEREFVIAYVLTRASTNPNSFDGDGAAKAAREAWRVIERCAG
jgi:hypothetical protein